MRRHVRRLRLRVNVYRGLPSVPRHLWPVHLTAGMISLDVAELLYSLAREVDDGVIVEVGSFRVGRRSPWRRVLVLGMAHRCSP
jgi:hypothetical protein